VEVCIQHDDSESEEKDGILVLEWTAEVIACIILPIALCKGTHDSINLLGFAWKLETTIRQQVPKPDRKQENKKTCC
jgi:hypothetical protein